MALLEAKAVNVVYEPNRGQKIWSVRDVDLRLEQGEFVGLVGESGCGKSTLGFALTRMLRPPAHLEGGIISFDGQDISALEGEPLRQQRRNGFAIVLQSGMNALNPVRDIAHHFADIFRAHARDGEDLTSGVLGTRGAALLQSVQLDPDVLGRFPHELSGGMRQRVSIALALALQPRLIVFDEPTTALDVIVQGAVIKTIKDLQAKNSFTAILISHDLGVVLDATDRVMVMYAGRIVEEAVTRSIFARPLHPYTKGLISAFPSARGPRRALTGIAGNPPNLADPPAGCRFHPRCPEAFPACREREPELLPVDNASVRCLLFEPRQADKQEPGR